MLLIEYPKCSTCRKAKKWLDEHQIAYTDRHIVEENPTMEELKAWQAASGLPVRKFFNTSGMLYKEMHLKEKLAVGGVTNMYVITEKQMQADLVLRP